MTRDELLALQWRKLTTGLGRVLSSNTFYINKFRDAGIEFESLRSFDDFSAISFTTKEELLTDQEASPPYGTNLTFPLDQYVRVFQTSGTSGRRLRWLDNAESWQWILDCWEIIFGAVGVRKPGRFFFPFSFGPFLGFWAAFDGAARLGHFVLPGGGMTTSARLHLMRDHRANYVLCTPTYALRMAEVAELDGFDLAQTSVEGIILAGEPGASVASIRDRIENAFAARVFDHSGMTEIGSLGIEFVDYPRKLFLLENHAVAEFIDPETGKTVPEGEMGELVLTNLGRWGSPLIRYRTGDLVRWRADVAPEGYPFVYLDGGILGRADDMLFIKGNNIYPSALEAVLREFQQVCEYMIEARDTAGATGITILVEPFPDSDGAKLTAEIAKVIQDRFYFRPVVRTVEHGMLPRYEMKARRFVRKSAHE